MRKLILTLLFLSTSARAELAIVVHQNNPLTVMSVQQVQEIFLGRIHTFPNGGFVAPVDQSSSARAQFYQALTRRPIEQIDAYWARLKFTGRASPPRQVADDDAVLNSIRANEGAIGYVDSARTDASVRVLLVLP